MYIHKDIDSKEARGKKNPQEIKQTTINACNMVIQNDMAQKYLLAWKNVQNTKGRHRLQRICTIQTHTCFNIVNANL